MKEEDSGSILGRWMMLRTGNGEACRQAATEREVGVSSYRGGRGALVVVNGGRLGYMTFVSMVMVSPSPTRREMVL